ncbi:MAG: polysaccharide deacetylase family protein [Proteobacteria bacterium]|nr:polysaccharide deacetylase family protein [Pseudomonadota bacterium]
MKKLNLTFDNGPTVETTAMVLDELLQRNLLASFCVVGKQLESAAGQDLARRALAEGHRIVNHSLTHGTALGDDPSDAHANAEVDQMHDLMQTSLGDWGARWFRPFGRGGKIGPHLFSAASVARFADLQYSVLLWNSVPRDWVDTQGWVETALKDIQQQNNTVLVLHDLPTGAMLNLPRFLDEVHKLDVQITQELPRDCVPFEHGKAIFDQAHLARLTTG